MTCRELIDFLSGYLERELPGEQRAEFDRHLGLCSACRNYLRTYEETVRLGRAALRPSDDEVPPEVPPELLAAVLAARKRSPG